MQSHFAPTSSSRRGRIRRDTGCAVASLFSKLKWRLLLPVVVSPFKADGAGPRHKTQHRMWSDTKEKEHERLDHRARSAPERQNYRKRNADLFMEASRPRRTHSYTLRGRTARKKPDPGKDGLRGTGARRSTVPDAGSWLAPATDQGTPFHWRRDLAPGLKSAWTEVAQ